MKRSCFALSILMASLSASLLWGDAGRHSDAAPGQVVAARDAVPRPPRVDDECDAASSEAAWAAVKDGACFAGCEDICGFGAASKDACYYDACHLPDDSLAHPADLPEAMIEDASAAVVSTAAEEAPADVISEASQEDANTTDPRYLSQYDAIYDEQVYGESQNTTVQLVDESKELTNETAQDEVAEAEATAESSATADDSYIYETYDYEAYSEDYADEAEALEAEMTAEAATDEAAEEPAADEVAAQEAVAEDFSNAEAANGSSGYEYEYDYNYDYDYGYDYEYHYDYGSQVDAPAAETTSEVVKDEATDEDEATEAEPVEDAVAADEEACFDDECEYFYSYEGGIIFAEPKQPAAEEPAAESELAEEAAATETETVAETEANAEADVAAEFGSYDYEYEYPYQSDYHYEPIPAETDSQGYEYDYDYDYNVDEYEAPAQDESKPAAEERKFVEAEAVAPPAVEEAPKANAGAVAAYLSDFVRNSVARCEPLSATLEAGVKIIAWSAGFDATLAIEAAAAAIADLPPGEADSLLLR